LEALWEAIVEEIRVGSAVNKSLGGARDSLRRLFISHFDLSTSPSDSLDLNTSGRPALTNKNTHHRTSGAASNASGKKTAKKTGKRAKQAQDASDALEQKRAYESKFPV
jgi:hypothetical protein